MATLGRAMDDADTAPKPCPVKCPKCDSDRGWDGPTYRREAYVGLYEITPEALIWVCRTCKYDLAQHPRDYVPPPPKPPPGTMRYVPSRSRWARLCDWVSRGGREP